MNKDELYRFTEELDKKMLADLKSDLDRELSLPEDERDYEAIAEMCELIAEINEADLSEEEEKGRIAAVTEAVIADRKRRCIDRVVKWVSALSACFIFCVVLNVYTTAAFGEDLFSTVAMFTKNGFSFDFSDFDDPYSSGIIVETTSAEEIPVTTFAVNTTTTEKKYTTTAYATYAVETTTPYAFNTTTTEEEYTTTYEFYTTTTEEKYTTTYVAATTEVSPVEAMLSFCQAYDVYPCYPEYGILWDMPLTEKSVDETDISTDFYFTFERYGQKLDLMIEVYDSREDIPSFLIPYDDPEYTSIPTSVGTVFVLADKRYSSRAYVQNYATAVFVHDNILYTIVGQKVSSGEFTDAVSSFIADSQN